MLVLQAIKLRIADAGPTTIIPVRVWADEIMGEIAGSAFSWNEIIEEIVMLAAERGVPVELGAEKTNS
jgi:hypothetical protein